MHQEDNIDQYIDSLINDELRKIIQNKIAPYTCQLLKYDLQKGLSSFASGVLIKFEGCYYILTASHVIEDWSDSNKLFIQIINGYMSIVGKACGTHINKEERLDVAYIKLKKAAVPKLKTLHKFLPAKGLLHHAKNLHEANYCILGFPVTINKVVDVKVRPTAAAYFVRPHPDKVFEYYNLDPFSHYVLEIKGKAVNIKTGLTEKIKTEYYGLSGGGLWYTEIDFDGKKFLRHANLIGIMTEFRKGKHECLIANRLEIVLASIHQNELVQQLNSKTSGLVRAILQAIPKLLKRLKRNLV